MKEITKITILFFAIASIFTQCKKTKTEPTELSKLPAATQTGANTFGCLVNGKAWVAQRNDCSIFCQASFKVDYSGTNGGNLGITATNIKTGEGVDEGILIGFDSTNFKSKFIYSQTTSLSIGFTFIKNSIYFRSWDSLTACTGTINLTTYNLQTGVVSGNFEFTLTKPNAQPIIVTEGRFDKKL